MLKTLSTNEAEEKIKSLSNDLKGDRSSSDKTAITVTDNDELVAKTAKDIDAVTVAKLRQQTNYTIHFTYGGTVTRWNYNPLNYPVHDLTQSGLADRVTDMARGHVFFDADRGVWRAWNGQLWVKIGNKNASDLYQIADQLPGMIKWEREHSLISNDSVELSDNQFATFQRTTGSKSTLSSIFDLCKAEKRLGKTRVDYDKYPYILNFQNGEYQVAVTDENGNLQKGPRKLQKHVKNHLATTLIPFNFNPQAKAPRFKKFIETFTGGNQAMIDYIQLVAGYTLFGENTFEHFFVIHGSGSTGKSTFLKILASALGYDVEDEELAQSVTGIPFNLFTNAKITDANANTPALARLAGKLLAVTTEPGKNDVLDEGFVKSATGRDALTATRKYEQPFTFTPKFKLFIATNDFPKSSASDAILRRMIMIPANHVVKSKNLNFNANLVSQVREHEMQGVIAWMVQGAQKLVEIAIDQTKKANQIKAQIKAGKLDQDKAPTIEKDPLILMMPDEVKREGLHYATSANTAAQFLQDELLTKEEYWNEVATSKALDTEVYFAPLHYKKNGAPQSAKGANRGERYGQAQPVVIDKCSYVLRRDLYQVYRQKYCKDQGIQHPLTQKHFNDVVKQYVPSAHVAAGTAWLGIGLAPSHDGYNWDEASYGEAIEIIRHAIDPHNPKKVKDVLKLFDMLQTSTRIRSKQQAKVDDFIKNHDSAFLSGGHGEVKELYNPVMCHYDDIEEAKKQRIKKAQHAMFD